MDVSYFNTGFLRQGSAALDRAYLGITGVEVPNGGTTGQVLVKLSNANGDVGWATVSVTPQFLSGAGPPVAPPATSPAQYIDTSTGGVYYYYSGSWH